MIVCGYCGRENEDASKYCGDCGKPLGRSPSGQEGSTCPACGAGLRIGLPFCPACGKRVTVAASGAACPACGVPTAPGAQFCAACGRSLLGGTGARRMSGTGGAPGTTKGELALLDEAGNVVGTFPLAGEETTIGREEADISFPDDPFLSPLHAQLNVREGEIVLRDLGSRNGTWYFLEEPYRLQDGDQVLIGSQILKFRRLGYPGPNPPEADATRRMGSLIPSADIASLTQLRSDGSARDVMHLSPGREVTIGREEGDWIFPYDPSMSGTHARIRSEDADFVIVDEGSRNGVAVSARGDRVLHRGSRFLVGDKLLRVESP